MSEQSGLEKNKVPVTLTQGNQGNQESKTNPEDQAAQEAHKIQACDIQTLARLAGLERALERFPDDLQTAARTALKVRASSQASSDNTAELWPVMQVKS